MAASDIIKTVSQYSLIKETLFAKICEHSEEKIMLNIVKVFEEDYCLCLTLTHRDYIVPECSQIKSLYSHRATRQILVSHN